MLEGRTWEGLLGLYVRMWLTGQGETCLPLGKYYVEANCWGLWLNGKSCGRMTVVGMAVMRHGQQWQIVEPMTLLIG